MPVWYFQSRGMNFCNIEDINNLNRVIYFHTNVSSKVFVTQHPLSSLISVTAVGAYTAHISKLHDKILRYMFQSIWLPSHCSTKIKYNNFFIKKEWNGDLRGTNCVIGQLRNPVTVVLAIEVNRKVVW